MHKVRTSNRIALNLELTNLIGNGFFFKRIISTIHAHSVAYMGVLKKSIRALLFGLELHQHICPLDV